VLQGEHDFSTRPSLESLVETLLDENDLVVIDLSEVRFVDSSIVNFLLETKQTAPDRSCAFRVQVGQAAVVHRLLEITGVLVLLDWAPTREHALNG
jgi:anti-anti-sigma factor